MPISAFFIFKLLSMFCNIFKLLGMFWGCRNCSNLSPSLHGDLFPPMCEATCGLPVEFNHASPVGIFPIMSPHRKVVKRLLVIDRTSDLGGDGATAQPRRGATAQRPHHASPVVAHACHRHLRKRRRLPPPRPTSSAKTGSTKTCQNLVAIIDATSAIQVLRV